MCVHVCLALVASDGKLSEGLGTRLCVIASVCVFMYVQVCVHVSLEMRLVCVVCLHLCMCVCAFMQIRMCAGMYTCWVCGQLWGVQ